MAAAERLYGYGKSPSGDVTYTASIFDTDFTGTKTEFDLEQEGIKIKWDTGETDNRHAPVLGSSCEIKGIYRQTDTDMTTFLEDLRTSKEGRFTLRIVSTGTYTTVWRGVIIADTSYESDTAGLATVTIGAVDGIAALKDVPYLNTDALYADRLKVVGHVARALIKMPHTAFWGASDPFIETSVDWWAVGATGGGANDSMNTTNIGSDAFYNYNSSGGLDEDVLSCYQVIEQIMITFGARIYQFGDVFRIEQIDYRANTAYEYRRYSKTAVQLSNSTRSGVNTINQTRFGAKVSNVTFDYIPQLWKVKINYQNKKRRNFWGNIFLNQDTPFNFNQLIDSNGGAITFMMQGVITLRLKNVSYSGNFMDVIRVGMGVKLRIGSNYLSRGYVSTTPLVYNDAVWNTYYSSNLNVMSSTTQVPPTGSTKYLVIPFMIVTPPLPADGEINSVSCAPVNVYNINGNSVNPLQFEYTYQVSSMWLSVFNQGTPDVEEDEILYQSINPNTGTVIYDKKVLLGAGDTNSAGRLTATTNAPLLSWRIGTSTSYQTIGGILAQQMLNGQLRPLKRINGELYGTLDPMKLIQTADGINWMMMRAEWSPLSDRINGSWFEVNYGTAAVPSTPIKVKIIKGGTDNPTTSFPQTPVPTGGGNSGYATNPTPMVLAPVAFNNTTTAIAAAATVTSIGLVTALAGNEFAAGDDITLVNPITGQYQTFAVASTPAPGATSISVTSEVADFDAPEKSYLVVKQKVNAFALPTGTQGQVLRYNNSSSKWEAYSGDADGKALVWDTTNGWQAETISAGMPASIVAFGTLGAALTVGSATSITLSSALSYTMFFSNYDRIMIYNEATGYSLMVTVSGTHSGPSTTIGIDFISITTELPIGCKLICVYSYKSLGTITSITLNGTTGVAASGGPFYGGAAIFGLTLNNDLAALEGMTGTGLVVRSATNAYEQRTIAAGTGISITNGDGVSGNPTITCSLIGLPTGAYYRIPYYTGTATLSNEAGFEYDPTNNRLAVDGTVKLKLLAGVYGSPSLAFHAGCGTSPTLAFCDGGSLELYVEFTSGTGTVGGDNDLFTITMPFAMPGNAYPVWSALNANAAKLMTSIYCSTSVTSTTFKMAHHSGGFASMQPSTLYIFRFIIISNIAA
jgi:hypothetical protein